MNIENLVDEFGALNSALKQYDHMAKRRDEIKKLLSEHCDTVSTDSEVKLVGTTYFVSFTKPSITRTVKSLPDLFNAMNTNDFFSCIKVSITKACKHLNKTQQAELLESSPGARRLKTVDVRVTKTSEEVALENFYGTLNAAMQSILPRH